MTGGQVSKIQYRLKHKHELAKQQKEWYEKNKDKLLRHVREKRQAILEADGHSACVILQKHADDLKDDPERLSTAFMKKIIGIEC